MAGLEEAGIVAEQDGHAGQKAAPDRANVSKPTVLNDDTSNAENGVEKEGVRMADIDAMKKLLESTDCSGDVAMRDFSARYVRVDEVGSEKASEGSASGIATAGSGSNPAYNASAGDVQVEHDPSHPILEGDKEGSLPMGLPVVDAAAASTVDDFAPGGRLYQGMAKWTDKQGEHCVRVGDIVTVPKPLPDPVCVVVMVLEGHGFMLAAINNGAASRVAGMCAANKLKLQHRYVWMRCHQGDTVPCVPYVRKYEKVVDHVYGSLAVSSISNAARNWQILLLLTVQRML
eukprot:jgi/Mesvir1/21046/Mv08093-RA.1